MMIDQEQILEKCLLLKGRIVIPHWGVLSIHRTSATIDKSKGWIHPPGEEITFLEVPHLGREALEKELAQFVFSSPIDIVKLSKDISGLAKEKKAEGAWSLGRLGMLKNNGAQVSWVSSPPSNWSLLTDLPDIRLPNPVGSETSASTESREGGKSSVLSASDSGESRPAEESSSKGLFFILIMVLILALVMIIGSLLYWGPLSNQGLTEGELPVIKERMNVNPEEISSSIRKTSAQDIPMDSKSYFELNHRQSAVLHENQSFKDSSAISRGTEALDVESDAKPEQEVLTDDCIIIVGAFSKADNVQQMKEKLSLEGYNVYLASSPPLTRVGVYAPCPADEILKELRIIRRKVEPAAWILND
jgi:cell division septation protein DedD